MAARLIDGKAQAAALRSTIRQLVTCLPQPPCLATVLVGDDPASRIYVSNKTRACAEAGIRVRMEQHPASIGLEALLALIDRLNADPDVNGILLQLPLPAGLSASTIIARLDPNKDVDGLHPYNAGLLAQGTGHNGFIPCTPRGCLQLIRSVTPTLQGRTALVIGRSLLVGRPMASLLLNTDCTVTTAHSKSRNTAELARQADILVVAAGQPELVQPDWIRPGAIVIDVGISRTGNRITGDVAEAVHTTTDCHLTPVPGGVGPMTVANLLTNTMIAACRQTGRPLPEELAT